jgi:hypothetical protein
MSDFFDEGGYRVLSTPEFGHFDEGCFTGCLNLDPIRLARRARRMPMARTQAALTTHLCYLSLSPASCR